MTARWPRWGLAALLVCTAVLYLWNLSASGYGNTFYAAAAQSGAQSWSSWFFGSLDSGDFITVDKPPASLWVTGLSVRMFGMNSWAVLAPQAVAGVAAVAVSFAAVRRSIADPRQGAAAGLIAGAILAGTPAAALMFRFNNPDALLVLLMTIAAYCLARAVQSASWRWLSLVAVVLGTAFLTKMLQAFLVLPGFGLAYLLTAPTTWRNRLTHLAGALGVLLASAGWWVLVVQLIPAASRPYIGGSTDNTVLDLAFGYNGLSRLAGREAIGGGPSMKAMITSTGPNRLFNAEMGNEISWLLPAALLSLAFCGYVALRGGLSRDEKAATVSWGGWLLVSGAVFSFMQGMVHPYYTVALAPAVGALVGIGAVVAWRERAGWDGRIAMAGMLVLGAWWSSVVLRRNAFGPEWLPTSLVLVAAGGALLVLVGRRWSATAGLAAGVAAALAGTMAFSVTTAATPHHGAIPVAVAITHAPSPSSHGNPTIVSHVAAGSWMGDEDSNNQLSQLLSATKTPWSAATNGSQSAAALEIASGTAVMAIGGWSGDPTPTLAQFVDDVHAGKIAYFVEAGRGGANQPGGEVIREESHTAAHTREISDWVAAHYPATTVGTSLVYRLT